MLHEKKMELCNRNFGSGSSSIQQQYPISRGNEVKSRLYDWFNYCSYRQCFVWNSKYKIN